MKRKGLLGASLLWLHLVCTGVGAGAEATVAVFPQPKYTTVKPGLDYAELRVPSVPWRIFITRLDRQTSDLEARSTLGGGDRFGMATVPAQARASTASGWTPLAAVNGGYFRETRGFERATLAGLGIVDGELVGAPANTSLWVDATNGWHIAVVHSRMEITWPDGSTSPLGLNELPATNRPSLVTARFGSAISAQSGIAVELAAADNQPWPAIRASSNYTAVIRRQLTGDEVHVPIGSAILLVHPAQAAGLSQMVPGKSVVLSTALSQDLSQARAAFGAGPTLLAAGQVNERVLGPKADNRRNPRTVVGFNGRYCFLIVVDGRALSSAGMTFAELARLLAQLGCTEAINLDGGTSTTMWVNGKVVNSPSGWITPAVGNALVIGRRNP